MRRFVPILAFVSLLAVGPAGAGVPCGDATQNIEPSFSLDGSELVFVSGGEGGCGSFGALELASSNGGRPLGLTPDDVVASDPQLSPDGSLVAFTAKAKPFPTMTVTLDVVRTDGTGLRVLAAGGGPSWSPDGRELAFNAVGGVYAIRADGTGLRRITSGVDPVWSPSGAWIAVAAYEGRIGLAVVRPDGSDPRIVSPGGGVSFNRLGNLPVWSRDGRALAYAEGGVDGVFSILVANADGSDWRTAAQSRTGPLAFSPDDRRLLLAGGTVVDIATGKPTSPWPQEDVEATSPDWTHVALSLATGPAAYPGTDLYVAPASGREPRLVSPYRCDNVACSRGTDGPDDLGPDSVFQTSIYGYGGDDIIRASYWRIVAEASFGDDTVYGGPANDRLLGGPGNDTIYGGPGDDRIVGGPGDDRLFSGIGGGWIDGGDGNDFIDARAGRGVSIACGPGRDLVLANHTDYVGKSCERVLQT